MERRPTIIRREELGVGICIRRAKGASFCQVERMSPVVRERPCITSGSQRWVGARPSFIHNARIPRTEEAGWVIWLISHWPMNHALVVAANRRVAAAAA